MLAIIGVLAGIIIPVVGKVREKAHDTQCKSSLRQWGVAMRLYIEDHKGVMPGPCWTTVQNQKGGSNHLASHLAPYMDLVLDGERLPDNYLCRAWVRERTAEDAPIWSLARRAPRRSGNGSGIQPFGYPGDAQPLRWIALDADTDIRTSVALRDIDKGVATTDGLPEKPVHGAYRNVLFLDWHVGVEKVE